MNMKKVGVTVGVLVLVVCCVMWFFHRRSDAAMQKVRDLQKEVFAENGRPNPEKMEELQQAVRALSEGQRREVMHAFSEQRMERSNQEVSGYFALPPQQRTAYLDKQIRAMEDRAKMWEARRAQQPQNRQRPPQGQGNSAAPQQGNPGAGQGGGGRNRSPEARLTRRNSMLDRSTPQQRAQRAEYFDAMRKRRIALGLPATPQGGHRH